MEYEKLLELQNLTKKTYNESIQFRHENPYCNRLESNFLNDPKIEKQRLKCCKLDSKMFEASLKFLEYRVRLERKYKFHFPIECYSLTTFAEYFHHMIEGGQYAK